MDRSCWNRKGKRQLLESYDVLRREIRLYNTEVYKKDFIIVINKTDLISGPDVPKKVKERLAKSGKKVVAISAATGDGIKGLIKELYMRVKESRENTLTGEERQKQGEKLYTIPGKEMEKRKIRIEQTPDGYIVRNRQLERMVSMTDLENEEALDYLMHRLKKMKVGDKLKSLGIDEGSTVIIGKLVFDLVE